MGTDTDEARWAEAQSILDRTPTESAERRIRRSRRLALLLVLAIVVVIGAAAAVGTVLLRENTGAYDMSDDVATWQVVAGFALSGLALLVMFAAVVSQFRANRRIGAWRSPMSALTRQQRKGLLAQVRGRAPIEESRVPLARHLAELLTNRRTVFVLNLAMLVMFAGQWIALRAWWNLALAGWTGVAALAFWLAFRRDEQRARRFLDTHPAPESVA